MLCLGPIGYWILDIGDLNKGDYDTSDYYRYVIGSDIE